MIKKFIWSKEMESSHDPNHLGLVNEKFPKGNIIEANPNIMIIRLGQKFQLQKSPMTSQIYTIQKYPVKILNFQASC